jgi:hypothetical protein
VVAFLVSLLLSLAMVGAIVRVGRSRPVGTPLTWGEAFGAAVFVFLLLFLLYGVVPHQWLAWADNELGWRSDTVGIPLGPFGGLLNGKLGVKEGLLFPEGVPLPNGHFIITAQVLRDIIAAGLYIVFLVAQILMWLWWQKRDQRKPGDQAELTSAYGRPLVRGS